MSSSAISRAAGVCAAALALCLFSGGVALADTSGLPPLPSVPGVPSVSGVPSPDNVITTLDQTVKQVTSTQPPTTPPSTTPPSSSDPGTAQPPATSQPATSTKTVKSQPKHAAAAKAVRPIAPATALGSAPTAGVTPVSFAMPPASQVTTATAPAPAVAPLLMPQSTQQVTPSAALADLDKHSGGSPMRAILLTLALAAAAGVGYEHLRLVRR